MDAINIFNQLPFDGIKTAKLQKYDAFEVVLIVLEQGKELKSHTSPSNAFVYVAEGEILFTLKGKEHCLLAGQTISFGAEETHAVKAVKNSRFLLVK